MAAFKLRPDTIAPLQDPLDPALDLIAESQLYVDTYYLFISGAQFTTFKMYLNFRDFNSPSPV